MNNSMSISYRISVLLMLLNLTICFDVKLPDLSFKMPINFLYFLIFEIIDEKPLPP